MKRLLVCLALVPLIACTPGGEPPEADGGGGGGGGSLEDGGRGGGGALDDGGIDDGGGGGGEEEDGGDPPDSGRCNDYRKTRNVYFGDLHVHTSYSHDAYAFNTRNDPDDAYDFARGAEVPLAPLDGGTRSAKLDRPLDFMAVTDHSQAMATPESGGSIEEAWARTRRAAERANDTTSACTFSSIVGYEWSGRVAGVWKHRNVLFNGNTVPSLPYSPFTHPRPEQLWAALDTGCVKAGTGCDAMVIPHNSNFTQGIMFDLEDTPTPALRQKRARYERLAEIYQHKGTSECRRGVETNDPLCDFEQLYGEVDCTATPSDKHCAAGNFVRNALRRGLAEHEKTGVNPLKLGIIASTDTHNGIGGATERYDYQGHAGDKDGDPYFRITRKSAQGLGGLTAVWAEQNDRATLYAALKRREVYGTSGPRMKVRFFGGWDLPADLCSQTNLAQLGYQKGVPMGGTLTAATTPTAPKFVAWALKDPGVAGQPGAPLQHLQIVKGWVDPTTGKTSERVYEVAGDPKNGASVDPTTCERTGTGAASLCQVWVDPDYVKGQRAFYYVRVLENPSCSIRGYDCLKLPNPKPKECSDGSLDLAIQDRAWSSPIWVNP